MTDKPKEPNAPSVPSTPRTDPSNVPNVPATDGGADKPGDNDPMRTTHPDRGESGKR